MNLADVVRSECVVAGAVLADKAATLHEVARAAKLSPVLSDVTESEILVGLERREALGSTGLGRGVAIPHCRLSRVQEFVVGLVSIPSGVDFHSVDAQPVKLVVFIVAPERESNEHIRLLSAISRILRAEGVVEKMLEAGGPELLRERFLQHAPALTIDAEDRQRSLLQVFIQNEDAFHEIVQMLAELAPCSLSIVDSENASAYLSRLPLFAGFWTDTPSQFARVVLAVVDRRLVNEIVRRIEDITGPLSERTGVMVTVQNVFHTAGSLET